MTTWADIQRGIFAGESGGDYNALFGYANRPGGLYQDVRPTQMTINEVLAFQNPAGPYGQYVGALNKGEVSTPVGAYQIVGDTLRNAVKGMGLTGQETFTPEMQDRIGRWIYEQQGTGAWEGYKGPQAARGTEMTPQQQQQMGLLAQMQPSPADRRRDFMGRLAMAANTLRMNPDPNVPAIVEGRRQDRQANRTAQWLAQQPGGEPYARMALSGNAAQALQAYYQAQAADKPVKGVAVEGRLINPITGEVMYEPEAAGYDPKEMSSLRKEFVGLQPVKDFSKQASAYGRVIASAEDPSAAGDLALIFNYMKVLDPGSTVREGEFATAQNAAGVDQRTLSLYNRVTKGTRLTEQQRADFADRATRLYQDASDQFEGLKSQYATIAEAQGFPIDLTLPSFAYSGDIYQMPAKFKVPPAPAGTDPATWADVWANMTDEERLLFMENSQ